MSVSLPSGFRHLKVSACLVTTIIAIPVIVSLLDWKQYFLFAWNPFIYEWHQFWRIILVQLQFQNESEVVVASILIITKFKSIERVFGSLKLAKTLFLLYIYNTFAITLIYSLLYLLLGWNVFLPSGPFGIIFGLLHIYNNTTPTLYHFELLFNNVVNMRPFGEVVKITLSDKFTTYLLVTILFFNEGLISSTLPSSIGYFIGYLYWNELLPINDASLSFMDSYFSKSIIESNNTDSLSEGADDQDNQPDEQRNDTPPRTLGQQLFDTFRR